MTEILFAVSPSVFSWNMLGRGSSAAFLLPRSEKGVFAWFTVIQSAYEWQQIWDDYETYKIKLAALWNSRKLNLVWYMLVQFGSYIAPRIDPSRAQPTPAVSHLYAMESCVACSGNIMLKRSSEWHALCKRL